MDLSNEQIDQLEFEIAPNFARQLLALLFAAFFLLPLIWIFLAVDRARLAQAFTDSALGWLLCGMSLLPAMFFLRLAFPPRKSWARLRIRRDSISFLPGRLVARYLAQPEINATISKRANEILIRKKGMPAVYAVVVRSADSGEQQVYAGASLTLHSIEEGQKILEGISAVTGLPCRLVRGQRLPDGTVEEVQWTPNTRRTKFRLIALLASAALSLLGGIIAGYLVTSPIFISLIGLALWFLWRVMDDLLSSKALRGNSARTKNMAVKLGIDFFLFEVNYIVAFVLVFFIFRGR